MYSDYAEDENSKNPFFIGTVVDNNDPARSYRVKVRLPKIHQNISDADLPWAARVDRAFRGIESDTPDPNKKESEGSTGGKSNTQQESKQEEKKNKGKQPPKFDHCVPEVGTKVLVLAIQNDVNSLIYLGALYKKTDYTPTDESKYLKTYGVYSNEEQFIGIDCTNDKDSEIKIHFIGNVDVDKVKNISVKAKEDIIVTTEKNITIKTTGEANIVILNEKGTVEVNCKNLKAKASESATIDAPNIELKGNVHITGLLTVDEDVMANTTSLKTHVHTSSAPGDPTSPPTV